MMIGVLTVLALLVQTPAKSEVEWKAPSDFIEGEQFRVSVHFEAPEDAPVNLPAWKLTHAAFSVNGRALGRRTETTIVRIDPGAKLDLTFDLEPFLTESTFLDKRNFRLNFGGARIEKARDIAYLQAAEKGIAFQDMPLSQLSDYNVILRTGKGDIRLELWVKNAPNHVRNFLDLAYTGFYDGSPFHHVQEGSLIQSGQHRAGIPAPRTLNAEFNNRHHLPGVLSMARPDSSPNSATSEFFIMQGVSPSRDGQYSAFGRVVHGLDVVKLIARTGNKSYNEDDPLSFVPPVPVIITKTIVVKAPRR